MTTVYAVKTLESATWSGRKRKFVESWCYGCQLFASLDAAKRQAKFVASDKSRRFPLVAPKVVKLKPEFASKLVSLYGAVIID